MSEPPLGPVSRSENSESLGPAHPAGPHRVLACGAAASPVKRGAARPSCFRIALEGGITRFDVAPAYGNGLSERTLGRVLRASRIEVAVNTKVGIPVRFVSGAKVTASSLSSDLPTLRLDRPTACVRASRLPSHDASPEPRTEPSSAAGSDCRDLLPARAHRGVLNCRIERYRRTRYLRSSRQGRFARGGIAGPRYACTRSTG
jgi:hypothetical protein